MSGGHFNYQQYVLREIAEEIKDYMEGHPLYDEDVEVYDMENRNGWLDKNEYEYIVKNRHTMPNRRQFKADTLEEFKKAYRLLRTAEIFAQRIDWLMSDDDDENDFHKRLDEDMEALERELKENCI